MTAGESAGRSHEPGLVGRTILAATADRHLAVALTRESRRWRCRIAVACPSSEAVAEINLMADSDALGFAIALDDVEAWRRVIAHVEQRLGPIDEVIVDADGSMADFLSSQLSGDMNRRGRGALHPLTGAGRPADEIAREMFATIATTAG